ncbi:hypothetical protein R6Q57_007722 [Mikania cordata]
MNLSLLKNIRLTWSPSWKCTPTTPDEIKEIQEMANLLHVVNLIKDPNRWSWSLDLSGFYYVQSVEKKIQSLNYNPTGYIQSWNNWVLKKVNFLVWRFEVESLPTLGALFTRNSQLCKFCGDYTETASHIFVDCALAISMDLLEWHHFSQGSKKWKKAIHAVILTMFWCLWKARNDIVFNMKQASLGKIIEEIKVLSYLWISSRSKTLTLSWDDWCCFSGFV